MVWLLYFVVYFDTLELRYLVFYSKYILVPLCPTLCVCSQNIQSLKGKTVPDNVKGMFTCIIFANIM